MGSASVADIDGDGIPEIFIGSRDYRLYEIKPMVQLNATGTQTTSSSSISMVTTSEKYTNSTQNAMTNVTSSTGGIGLTQGVGRYRPTVDWQLIASVFIVSLAIVIAVYVYTKD
jgi:hypothetical protein